MRVRCIDSHTGGEPTRTVLLGEIELQGATMDERREDFRRCHDHIRRGLVNEPRGNDIWVGALLTPPTHEGSIAGVVFFNAAGYLGMCGHGTIGVIETLRHLGQISGGKHRLDTPVGTVEAELLDDGEVQLVNVRSYRHIADLELDVPGVGRVVGDVGYGGNWFYIVHEPKFVISVARQDELTQVCWRIRHELVRRGITGADGEEIDHVELFGAGFTGADSQNFVQCPGGAYDRSPCGTGTSAKLACLYAAGKLAEGEVYRQASVTDSVFRGSVQAVEGGVIPTIIGRAHVTSEATFIFDDADPLKWGFGV